jgi:hypothetical protein
MSGSGYRKRYSKKIQQGAEGHYPSHNIALTLRHRGQSQGVCVPLVAGRIYFVAGAGQPHPFTGSRAPPGGRAMRVRFSGVVSAESLGEIGSRLARAIHGFYE